MKINKKVVELLFQIIPVMVGVYLGFAVSHCSDSSQRNSKKKILVENLIREIRDNQNNVSAVVFYHEMLRDSALHYMELNKNSMPSIFRGVNTLTLTNSAFETGVQTGLINELSIDEIQSLNRIYASQRSYNEFCNILLSGLIDKDLTGNSESIKTTLQYLTISMTDIAIKERDLLKEYESILNNTLGRE